MDEFIKNYKGGIALLIDHTCQIIAVNSDFSSYLKHAIPNITEKRIEDIIEYKNNSHINFRKFYRENQNYCYASIQGIVFHWTLSEFKHLDQHQVIVIGIKREATTIKCDEYQYLKKIIDNIPQYIFWKDKSSTFLGCNRNFSQLVGLKSSSEIVGKTDYDLPWSTQESNNYTHDDRKIMQSGKPKLFYEETQRQRDGKEHDVIVSKMPLVSHGETMGLVCIYEDITERKKLEEKLRKTEISEARFKAMSALGGMIAHELRTPLTGLGASALAIQQLLPLLIEGYEKSFARGEVELIRQDRLKALKRSVAHMRRSIQYAQNTITTVVSGFNYTDPNAQIMPKPFLLNRMIEEAIANYPFNVHEDDLYTIRPIQNVTVLGDKLMIIHVIHNLLKNALHAIHSAKRGHISIWSDVNKNHNHVTFCIQDTAKGINAEELAHIFDAFYTTKHNSAASIGLGLYFSKMVIQNMRGDITCESKQGRYTRFTIKLPLAQT